MSLNLNCNFYLHIQRYYVKYCWVNCNTNKTISFEKSSNRIKIEPLSSDILIFYTSIENYNQIENEETENLNRINKERNAFEKQGKDNINAI